MLCHLLFLSFLSINRARFSWINHLTVTYLREKKIELVVLEN